MVFVTTFIVLVVAGEIWRSGAIARTGRTPLPLPLLDCSGFVLGLFLSILASLLHNDSLKFCAGVISLTSGIVAVATTLLELSKSMKVPWIVTSSILGLGAVIVALGGAGIATSSGEGLSNIGYGLFIVLGLAVIALGAPFAFVIVTRTICNRLRTKHLAVRSTVTH